MDCGRDDPRRVSQASRGGKARGAIVTPGCLGGLPLDPAALRDLAALLEPPVVPVPGWLAAALGPGPMVRVGLGDGSVLAAMARAAERAGSGASVLAAPWGAGDPGPDARAAAACHPDAIRLVEGMGAARRTVAPGSARLVWLASADALPEWVATMHPEGALVLDGEGRDALREALGPGAAVVRLGGATVGVPTGGGPLAALSDPAITGPLDAVLSGLAGVPAAGPDPALGAARARTLAAIREAGAAREELGRLARRHDAEGTSLLAAAEAREARLSQALARIAQLEAEARGLRRSLEERFEEIAVLTQERLAAEAPR